MIDIIVFALPVDRERAGAIVDALVERQIAGVNRTRFITEHPDSGGWREAVNAVQNCPCVIFCWSRASAAPDAELMVVLARRVLMAGHAISVELDVGARPAALAVCTTYPLHDWRARPGGWRWFLYGKGFVTQIAAAAQQKVLGRDPPPPSAYWRLVRAQAWIGLGGTAFALGIAASLIQFYRDPVIAKWLDPKAAEAFAAAKASTEPCKALRQFGVAHTGSAWSVEASELLATCRDTPITVREIVENPLPLYALSRAELPQLADAACARLALNADATLKSLRIENISPDGDLGFNATALCTLDQPREDRKDVMGGGSPPESQ
jgi:hypothetical protein